MFYDKHIDILRKVEGFRDEFGIYHPGDIVKIKTTRADVQPITRELAIKDFGYDEKVDYRVFCDVEQLVEGDLIGYDGEKYIIEKKLVWDDYIDMLVSLYD